MTHPPPRINGRCMVSHGPSLFLARVLMVHRKDDPYHVDTKKGLVPCSAPEAAGLPIEFVGIDCYYVKYLQYSSTPEWVPAERVVPESEHTSRNKAALDRHMMDEQRASRQSAAGGPLVLAVLEQSRGELQTTLTVPPRLQQLLVADYRRVVHHGLLVALPALLSVDRILDRFAVSATRASPDVVEGIRIYFNRLVQPLVLYPHEHPQHLGLDSTLTSSATYGAIHLLRLLVLLPALATTSLLDRDSVCALVEHVQLLVTFLDDCHADFFSVDEDYEAALPEYRERCRLLVAPGM